MHIEPQPGGFGATITGVDLGRTPSSDLTAAIRAAWLEHRVICFPGQPMGHATLERFTLGFGAFGDDPYVQSIEGHAHILEVRRDADETASPFGGGWHSDWSFQATPPSATILHAKVIPPVGGDTWYADGYAAYDALDAGLRTDVESLTAIHSARRPYSPSGALASGSGERSMTILASDSAYATQQHPVVRVHPETGRRALWINPVYTIGIVGMPDAQSRPLIRRLSAHATEGRFIYRHRWQPDMLTMWDNRCVLHAAQGGYDGHQRVLHRTTVAGDAPVGPVDSAVPRHTPDEVSVR